MRIKEQINKLVSLTGYSLKKLKPETIKNDLLKEIPEDEFQLLDEETCYLAMLDINLNFKHFDFFIRAYEMAKMLKLKKNAIFEVKDNKLLCHIGTMKCFVNTWEEVLILKEIYIDGIYNHYNNNKSILIDIGMNVGLTSLFFASKCNFTHIYSYEPFKPTFDAAQENIKLNSDISKKIDSFNYGLGTENKYIEIPYSYEYKGSMGLQGLPTHIEIDEKNVTCIRIEICSIVDEIFKIKNLSKGVEIVAKIDCEGSEYEIIEKLSSEDMLKFIDVIMMEWHKKGPKDLIDELIRSNFEVFSFDEINDNIGMIYAVNKSSI